MECKYNHDGDCCNSGAAQYMCKCKMPCVYIVPMTNADRIRAMSDEELAEFLCGISTAECCDRSCPARHICGYGDSGMIKWLQQPAKENDNA